jgi:hypothetical protein
MKAKDLDAKFDGGEEILDHLDLSRAKRRNLDHKRVNVDFPIWMVELLDKEAKRMGVTRQSVIKIWVDEKLHQVAI